MNLNKIYLGDCLDYMKEMEDNSVDLVLTDPPYGININHNMGRRKGDKHSEYAPCGWDSKSPAVCYFDEIFRISKNQIIFGANNFMSKIKKDSQCWIVWDKGFSEDLSFAQVELAWTSFKSSERGIEKRKEKNHRYNVSEKGKLRDANKHHKRRMQKQKTTPEHRITLIQWKKIIESQKNKCALCGCKFTANKPTMDHILPLSMGGEHTSANIQALCQSCNSSKCNRVDLNKIQSWCCGGELC